MNDSMNSSLPSKTEAWDALTRLALDLSWSWNHSADEIWKRLDPELWELTANPWLILQSMSQSKARCSKARGSNGCRVSPAHRTIADRVEREECGSGLVPNSAPIVPVAHGSLLQHGIHVERGAPIYSGGLGNVAGDQLKAASDLGVPVVAIGLLYQQGYFRQDLDAHGDQQVLYPVNEPTTVAHSPGTHSRMASCSGWP